MADVASSVPRPWMVYGSCVSRDLVELADGGRGSVARYTARQSLASAFGGGRSDLTLPVPSALSPFQRRMVTDDLRSALPAQLREAASRGVRAVLWDLTDERLGVYALPDGTVVTRSIDLISSGLDATLAARVLDGSAQFHEFGGPGHLDRWSRALAAFRDLARDLRLRVVLLDVPWAERDDLGRPTPSSFGTTARAANASFRRYVDLAARAVEVVTLRPHEVVAAHDHRWGAAPFHYTTETYLLAASRLPFGWRPTAPEPIGGVDG